MKFPDSFLEQIKGSFRLSEYIGRTVQLKRQGKELAGLSPFVTEKTPSFFVNDEKGMFFDFSGGRHGDIVDWLVMKDGLSFVEAVKRLAAEAGLTLPEQDRRTTEQDQRRRRLTAALEAAQALFSDNLLSADGRAARAYLEGRGLGAEDWKRFGIGYALDGNVHLKERLGNFGGFEYAELLAAGLLASADDRRPPHDRYRHRIMFPIRDAAGRLISFGGRALDPNARAKYLNGPETEIFDKGRNLYGLDMSRKLLAAGPGPLLVSEGYLDVIACLRAGIAGCAPMGTSLTEAQIELMWRHHPEPTLCFDSDAAGRRAAARAMDHALPKIGPGRSVRFVTLSGAKDPDELLRTRGADALRAQLVRAAPLVEALFQRELAAGPLETPEQRADLRERLRKLVRTIPERGLAREYEEAFRRRLEALRHRTAGDAPASSASVDSARALRAAFPPVVRALAYWLVKDPGRLASEIESVGSLGVPALDRLVESVVDWALSHEPDGEQLAQHLHGKGLGETVASLADPGDTLADPHTWRRVWRARMDYQRLDAEMRQLKDNMTGPEAMKTFLALKAQRDQAKAGL